MTEYIKNFSESKISKIQRVQQIRRQNFLFQTFWLISKYLSLCLMREKMLDFIFGRKKSKMNTKQSWSSLSLDHNV